MSLILAIIISYLYGAIPFGYLIAKRKGIDITRIQSGNIGTANVYRSLGFKYGALTFILDGSKGIFTLVLGVLLGVDPLILSVVSILGNLFSPFLKFRGGKGFANLMVFTIFYFIFTGNTTISLFLIIKYLITLALSGITSLSNLLYVVDLNIMSYLAGIYNPLFTLQAVLILYSHRENLVRLLHRVERISY